MARIDAGRGRIPGVNAAITTPSFIAGPGDLGLGAVADLVDQRARAMQARRAEAEGQEDALALAEGTSNFRIEASKHLDARADGFDGTGGPFADTLRTELQDLADQRLAGEPERRAANSRLRLMGVVDELSLAALDIEDRKRTAALAGGVKRAADAEANAILSDPAHFATARDQIDTLVAAAPAGLQPNLREELSETYAAAYAEARLRDDPQGFQGELNSGGLDADLAPADKARYLNAAANEIERRRRAAEIAADKVQRNAAASVADEIAAIEKAVGLGLPVAAGRLDRLGEVALQGGDETRAAFQEAAEIVRGAAAIQDLPPVEAARQIAAERARLRLQGDASGFEGRRVEALENAASGTETRLKQDFAGFLADRGAIEPLDPNGFDGEALARRTSTIQAEADFYGVEPQFFTETERRAISRLDPGSPALLQIAGALAGHSKGRALLAEIAPKNPELAHFGGLLLAGGEAAFVEDAVAGAAARREAGFEATLSSSVTAAGGGTAQIVAETYGGAFALAPDTAAQARNAAELAYEGKSARTNRTRDQFDARDFQRQLQRAAGGIFVRQNNRETLFGGVAALGGRKVQVPAWIENDKFARAFLSLTEKDFTEAGGPAFAATGEEFGFKELRRAIPVAVEEGVYQLFFNPPEEADAQFAVNPDGAPYRLDLNKIRGRINEKPVAGQLDPTPF